MGVAACQGQSERPLCPGAAEGRPECAAESSALQPPMIGILSAFFCIISNFKTQNESRYLIKAAPGRSGVRISTVNSVSLRLQRKCTSTAAALDNTAMNSTSEFQLKATVHWEMQTEFPWQLCPTLKPLAQAFICWSLTVRFINMMSGSPFTFSVFHRVLFKKLTGQLLLHNKKVLCGYYGNLLLIDITTMTEH